MSILVTGALATLAKGALSAVVGPMLEEAQSTAINAAQDVIRGKIAGRMSAEEWADIVIVGVDSVKERAVTGGNLRYVGGDIKFTRSKEDADEQSHTVSVRVEGKFLYIVEGLFLTTNAEADFAARQSEGLVGLKIDLSEIKNVEINSGYLVITKLSGNIIRVKGQEGEPEILHEAAETILGRIGKDPSELKEWEGPFDEQTREFVWTQRKVAHKFVDEIITVRVWLEQEMLRIQKELSDTITSHKNTIPEETIPLSEIQSVYAQEKGPSIAIIALLLCVPLVLYGIVSGNLDLGGAALCLLALALMCYRYRGQIKHCRLVIVKKDGKKIVLKGDKDSLQAMNEAAEAIAARVGIAPNTTPNQGGHKTVWIILGVVAVLLLGVLIVPELYLKQSLPAGVLQNRDVMDYVGTEINGDLNYQVTTEVTDGKMVKNTSMPQYVDGLFYYFYVDCVYDVTVTADNGESASGQATMNCSFSVKPFNGRLEDIIFNSFTYSDEVVDLANGQAPTHATEKSSNVNKTTSEPISSGPSIYDMVGQYDFHSPEDIYYSLAIILQDSNILIYANAGPLGSESIPTIQDTVIGPEHFKDNVLTFSDGMKEHTLTFVPASESAFGVNTIYIDGTEEIPYCLHSSFNDYTGTWREKIDGDNASMLYMEYSNGDASFRLVLPSGGVYTGKLEMDYYGDVSLSFGGYTYNLGVFDDQTITLKRFDDEQGFLFYHFKRVT